MGRILLLIVGFVVALGLAGASQQPTKAGGQNQPKAAQAVNQGTPIAAIPPHRHAELEDAGCEDRQDRRYSDLCAQWKAADAARSAATAAWVLGVIGAVLGAATLTAAWSAAHWAKQAATHTEAGAKASWATEKVTREASERQLRPYLKIKARDGMRFALGETVLFPFSIRNIGATPALNFCATWDCIIRPLGAAIDRKFPPGEPPRLLLMPTERVLVDATITPEHKITQANIDDLVAGKTKLYIVGTAKYRDIFGREHTHLFQHEFGGPDMLDAPALRPSWSGNSTT